MVLPDDYWASYEGEVRSLNGFIEAVRAISAYPTKTGARFVWRGVVDAGWGLHSSLVRCYKDRNRAYPLESDLRDLERRVLEEARYWSLDWHDSGGRLTALELLAALQQYGVPTRMLDFTFNPLVALWFAVEKDDDRDGRVFGIEVSELAPRHVFDRDPWWWSVPHDHYSDWFTDSYIWRPPPIEPRMARQEGCFLMGGVPRMPDQVRDEDGWRLLQEDELRACMSVPFRLRSYEQAKAAHKGLPAPASTHDAFAFTLRIARKRGVRRDLEQAFDYSHRSLFPDFPGLAERGRSWR